MPLSSQHVKRPDALALKQAANWQCRACGRQCRRQGEAIDDFALRVGHEVGAIAAHPRRWVLHVTKLDKASSIALGRRNSKQTSPDHPSVVLCGSCHRTYHNYQRWQQRQQQRRQHQERIGQLTLNDICLPLKGLQLSLNDWGTPYEIVNPQRKRKKPSKNPSNL